jgi:predicted DNA repair protein MutK
LSVGLLALLDDVASMVKLAAASLDDVIGQAGRAGVKAAGAVIDDAAVTPRYVSGFSPERELPMVGRIALGSIKNKLLFLLPGALALSFLAPWAVTPLLMIGGAYLCYEGAEKVYELVFPHKAHVHEQKLASAAVDPRSLEDEKVAGAIKTDFILSAEIMAIALATVTDGGLLAQAVVLFIVALGITLAVYGSVALIVKADDIGLSLAKNTSVSIVGSISRAAGRALVVGMPIFASTLSVVGTAAMIWVGGGIIVHGLAELGMPALADLVHDAAEAAAHLIPALAGMVTWLVTSLASGVVGLALGALLIPIASHVISPVWKSVTSVLRKAT